jgi:uncharacterized membrane protein YoaK (UPF0700 family)
MRNFVDEALLFLVPFALFALFLVATKRKVLSRDAWRGPAPWLMLSGLIVVAASFLYAGITAQRNLGDYEPPHMENGRVVPGRFK